MLRQRDRVDRYFESQRERKLAELGLTKEEYGALCRTAMDTFKPNLYTFGINLWRPDEPAEIVVMVKRKGTPEEALIEKFLGNLPHKIYDSEGYSKAISLRAEDYWMVDRKIKVLVRALNSKGFNTSASCEGHMENEDGWRRPSVYFVYLSDEKLGLMSGAVESFNLRSTVKWSTQREMSALNSGYSMPDHNALLQPGESSGSPLELSEQRKSARKLARFIARSLSHADANRSLIRE